MSAFNLVQQPSGSPSFCLACGGSRGPFIDLQLPFVKVPTAIGVLDADGSVYLCVGTDENPGCAVQIGRMSGLMVDTSILHDLQRINEQHREEIAELRGLLSKKSLTVGDVMAVLGREEVGV